MLLKSVSNEIREDGMYVCVCVCEREREREREREGQRERGRTSDDCCSAHQVRWSQSVKVLDMKLQGIVGDTLVASAAVAYLGAFTAHYRSVERKTSLVTSLFFFQANDGFSLMLPLIEKKCVCTSVKESESEAGSLQIKETCFVLKN